MKYFLLLFILVSYQTLTAQTASRAEVLDFWKTTIEPIKTMDLDKIIEHTEFPVQGSWGYAIELETGPDEWTKEDFISNISKIYNESFQASLKTKTYNDLTHAPTEAGDIEFVLNLFSNTVIEGSDEVMESAIILFFKKVDGIWKLYSIEYAG